jgi:hypothetical protein
MVTDGAIIPPADYDESAEGDGVVVVAGEHR